MAASRHIDRLIELRVQALHDIVNKHELACGPIEDLDKLRLAWQREAVGTLEEAGATRSEVAGFKTVGEISLLPGRTDRHSVILGKVLKQTQKLQEITERLERDARPERKAQPEQRREKIDSPGGWSAIEIRFLSEHRLQVFCGGEPKDVFNYAEFGFEDRRKGTRRGKPTKAWKSFLGLRRGPTRARDSAGSDRARLVKHMVTIRQKLHHVVKADGDPVPLVGELYTPQFRITVADAAELEDD